MMRQQQMNGGMSAAEGAPDLMQRLARLPTPPDVGPLRRRYLSPFPLCHKHHLMKTTRFRWCCIDLLNSPDFSAKWTTSGLPTTRPESLRLLPTDGSVDRLQTIHRPLKLLGF